MDILYQLLKRVTSVHLLPWLNSILSSRYPELHKCRGIRKTLVKASRRFRLVQQFDQIPCFSQLKHFENFSSMTQWIGKDYKDACRQLIFAIAPLLLRKYPDAIYCTSAVLDFVCIVDYTSHIDKTLRYMEYILM